MGGGGRRGRQCLAGTVRFSQGWSPVTNIVWNAFAFVLLLWLLVMGVLMWRKAGAVKKK